MSLLDILKRDKKVDIVKKGDDMIQQAEQSSMSHKLDLTKKIDNSFKKLNLDKTDIFEKTLFLLDVSGSMDDRVDGVRKIDHLRNVMTNYNNARKICFSSDVYVDNKIPEPNRGTNLAMALRYIRKSDNTAKRIVLVSDGEPDDESAALRDAKILALPIDIVFIGNKEGRGERFMEQLSQVTGGKRFIV